MCACDYFEAVMYYTATSTDSTDRDAFCGEVKHYSLFVCMCLPRAYCTC